MTDQQTPRMPCLPGHERCAVDGVECECEQIEQEKMAKHMRQGPSPTVCRVMAKFCDALGAHDESEIWLRASDMPRSAGNA